MKKILVVFVLLFIVVNNLLVAQSITMQEAEIVAKRAFIENAKQFLKSQEFNSQVSSNHSFKSKGITCYYVFNFEYGGFVIISANKSIQPVLAFSPVNNCPEINKSPQFEWWMQGYTQQIINAVKSKAVNDKAIVEWNRLLDNNYSLPVTKKALGVEPLIHTTWDQSPYYNGMCPVYSEASGGRCVTGCVATCLGQIMAYFRHPEKGVGEYSYVDENYGEQSVNFTEQTYNWDQMPSSLSRNNEEIAKLLYHIGVSVDMHYGPDGSGMTNHKGAFTLKTYFDYTDSTQYLFRDSIDIDWPGMLISSLDRNIPLYYAGWTDTNFVMGHAFVCDGYTDSTFFHMNWGWGGSSDGYFNIDHLTPGSNDFTLLHEAIINATPKTNYPNYFTGQKTLTSLDGLIDDGSGPLNNYKPNNTCSWLIEPFDSVSSITLSFVKVDILSSDTLYILITYRNPKSRV